MKNIMTENTAWESKAVENLVEQSRSLGLDSYCYAKTFYYCQRKSPVYEKKAQSDFFSRDS